MGMFGNSKFRSEDSDIPSPFKVLVDIVKL